ncbi:MAG: hypothetical protein KDC80_19140 [Saprospiraceae bacterium]|nr:hypothetical protein [Saprospiraceae bacterium]
MGKQLMKGLLILFFLSCQNKTDSPATSGSNTEVDDANDIGLTKGCYEYRDDENSIEFEITDTGSEVRGNLTYAFSGKDANKGAFTGKLIVDTLIGTYTFYSEGVESSREVAFMHVQDRLIEGYGPMSQAGTKFRNRKAISFSTKMPLAKTDCQQ